MNHRKAGVARALINKIQSVGEILNLNKIKAETSSTFDSAVVFYQKNKWTEVCFYPMEKQKLSIYFSKVRSVYYTTFSWSSIIYCINGMKLVTFMKDIASHH